MGLEEDPRVSSTSQRRGGGGGDASEVMRGWSLEVVGEEASEATWWGQSQGETGR